MENIKNVVYECFGLIQILEICVYGFSLTGAWELVMGRTGDLGGAVCKSRRGHDEVLFRISKRWLLSHLYHTVTNFFRSA